MTEIFDQEMLLLGEMGCWSLFGLQRLKEIFKSHKRSNVE